MKLFAVGLVNCTVLKFYTLMFYDSDYKTCFWHVAVRSHTGSSVVFTTSNTSWRSCYIFKISGTVMLLTFKVSVTTCNLNITINGPNIVIAQICIDTMLELPTTRSETLPTLRDFIITLTPSYHDTPLLNV